MKTNVGLVKHAKMARDEHWGYVWGAIGRLLDEAQFQALYAQYPREVGRYYSHIRSNWLGRRCADCVGLIKSYVWWQNGVIRYNSSQDVSADGMYYAAKKKGPIATMPEVPGLAVWKPGHIGIYIGDGKVIEARGTIKGVIESPLRGLGAVPWTHWLEVPYIAYQSAEVKKPRPTGPTTINVMVKGQRKKLPGVNVQGKTYLLIDGKQVPVRKTLETLGYKVGWDQATQTVIVT